MMSEKKISRKDFLKCIAGLFFSFVCVFKFPKIGYANSTVSAIDGNDICY